MLLLSLLLNRTYLNPTAAAKALFRPKTDSLGMVRPGLLGEDGTDLVGQQLIRFVIFVEPAAAPLPRGERRT